jgi:hypothetical protein
VTRAVSIKMFRRFEDTELEQLAGIVPLVQRVADLEPFVALKAYEIGLEHGGGGRCERRLPDAGFALEKERALQPEREEQSNRQTAVRHVPVIEQVRLQVGDRGRGHDSHYALPQSFDDESFMTERTSRGSFNYLSPVSESKREVVGQTGANWNQLIFG